VVGVLIESVQGSCILVKCHCKLRAVQEAGDRIIGRGATMIIQDLDDARFLVNLTVTTVLGKDVHKDPHQIDIDLTFTDADPDGYGRTILRYHKICEDVASELRHSSGRVFYYDIAFVDGHEGKSINDFIIDTAPILLASPLSDHAVEIADWVATAPSTSS
jgi:hypothetical protein